MCKMLNIVILITVLTAVILFDVPKAIIHIIKQIFKK
nr:MAG TPA_asm: hypothetical protein [Caudoviricetes sp.]